MEYEIDDDPQDARNPEDSELIKDHPALRNQSSVKPRDYPAEQLANQSLVQNKKKPADKTS